MTANAHAPTQGPKPFRIPLLYWLFIAIPIAAGLEFTHQEKHWVFLAACVSILPPAGSLGRATENL